ncbi:hypothetical protein [Fulvivirga ligni]|uniref:hypothetical protein n=1 Tax=Fulvivirga ligni TaxID=2904246 RepID=UPI001F2B269D|nr:hypothetical protein [Fulvivirga ligni]UII20645.1 hypothetical protein LVD16_22655 [Fulvivirga ligni]
MGDKLEDFIHAHKEEFNNEYPSDKVWKGIEEDMPQPHRKSYGWIWKAASILFFLSSVYLFLRLESLKQPQNLTAHNEITSEFTSVEEFYFNEISEKRELIADFESETLEMNPDFEQDMQKLDAMYQVLKEELVANPSKKVVDALILNLLVRVDILNKELEKLDKIDAEKEQASEGANV